jgi:hypothetical protein
MGMTKIGECKVCGAPIYSETITDFPSPIWSCGHFGWQFSVTVNSSGS